MCTPNRAHQSHPEEQGGSAYNLPWDIRRCMFVSGTSSLFNNRALKV